jgi:hypothetical protein
VADNEGKVVIVDNDGNRHIFPAGFDPVKAGMIVRGQTSTVKPVDLSKEPQTYWGGFAKGALEGSIGGAKGFAKGIVPGLAHGVADIATLPLSIAKAGANAVVGGIHLVQDPEKTIAGVGETFSKIPGQIADAYHSAIDLAGRDPEAFGNAVGDMTGRTMVGIAASKAAPLVPRPIARTVGEKLSTYGKKAELPMFLVGGHQIASGNILGGMGTMAVPSLMKGTGTKLSAFGENDPGWSDAIISRFKGEPKNLAKTRVPSETTVVGEKPVVRIVSNGGKTVSPEPPENDLYRTYKEASTPADKFNPHELRTAKEAAKAAENQARLDKIAQSREGMEATKPSISESVSAKTPEGGRTSMSTRYRLPEEEVPGGIDGLTAAENAMIDKQLAGNDPKVIASVKANFLQQKQGAAPKVIDNPLQPVRIAPTGAVPTVKPPAPTPAVASPSVSVKAPGEISATIIGESRVNPIDQELAARAVKAPKVPIKDVPVSKSRRSPRSTINPGLTLDEEAELFGGGPVFKVNELSQEVLQKLMERRAARAAAYRTNAGMDAGATRAMEREP